jgi:hypothetical protein
MVSRNRLEPHTVAQKPHNENDIDRIRCRTLEMPVVRPPARHGQNDCTPVCRRREIARDGSFGLIDGSLNPLIHMRQ